jgi:hypothetical protein
MIYNIYNLLKGGQSPMGSNAVMKAFRPRIIGARGMIVSIDLVNMQWFDQLLHKYYNNSLVRKIIKIVPNIEAIKVFNNDKQVALIIISPKPNPKLFRIDHFSGDNQEADFSVQMLLKKDGADFKSLTPNVSNQSFKQVVNFVLGVYTYECLMHTDKSCKTDVIAPIEIFGEALV